MHVASARVVVLLLVVVVPAGACATDRPAATTSSTTSSMAATTQVAVTTTPVVSSPVTTVPADVVPVVDVTDGDTLTVELAGGRAVVRLIGVNTPESGECFADESASNRYRFGALTLAPGAAVTLFSGCGTDTDTERFWCSERSAIWNNAGDTVFLRDRNGSTVAALSYRR